MESVNPEIVNHGLYNGLKTFNTFIFLVILTTWQDKTDQNLACYHDDPLKKVTVQTLYLKKAFSQYALSN